MHRLVLRTNRHLTGRRVSSSRSSFALSEMSPEKKASTGEQGNTSNGRADRHAGYSTSGEACIFFVGGSVCCCLGRSVGGCRLREGTGR